MFTASFHRLNPFQQPRRSPVVLAAALVALSSGGVITPRARAYTVYSDTFTGTSGTVLAGRAPDTTNLPTRTYTTTVQSSGQGTAPGLTGSGTAITGYNDTNYLSLASTGGYTKPTTITLSLSVEINTIAEDNATQGRGIGLGFFTTTPATGTESNTGFTGLVVEPSGALTLEVNGARTGTAVAAPANFSTTTLYPLTYTVNTATGGITSVTYNGTSYNSSFSTTAFTSTATNLVGFYSSSATSASNNGYVDNFSVTGVPEPATWLGGGLLAGAGLLGTVRRARRMRLA